MWWLSVIAEVDVHSRRLWIVLFAIGPQRKRLDSFFPNVAGKHCYSKIRVTYAI